jgi:hypothetical protein
MNVVSDMISYFGDHKQVGGRVDRRLFDQPQLIVRQHGYLQIRPGRTGAAHSRLV